MFKAFRMIAVLIGLIGGLFFLSSCDGAVKHGSQEVDGGYGGHSAGGHGGHGGAGH
ncbi:TPA: hypothetical protein ACIZB4_001231 [Legionella pneumophila]|uniref:Lipoprotein n=4 Tax=Legionella TaxID=445 RepID=A0A222P329_9GAMM|nr:MULTISPECIES: hypothetical protein [Legionella]ASQ46249.1 hypothetical protein clem_08485 [Legionella clemsonensis]AMV13772.1 hypothetical protein ULM_10890 [Legionella pneumophila]KTD06269.1 hypothetical protein Lgra_3046 [Legionella gratiana]MCK1848586.1 hypothetical protein [Legionella pneumophila]MCK1857717.1 hypothetical protein [Legionella pneumophila]